MSGDRRLTEADLLAQLRRRSTGVSNADLSVREFVVGVGSKIDHGAPSVTNRRLPALAGLAGAAAIVLVLFMAMPGIGPGGGSPTPTLGVPVVSAMSASDFAARLASGQLDGDTVLVSARILPYDGPMLYGATCSIEREQPVHPNFTCALGRLDGIVPAVWVDASYAARPSDDATFFPGAPYVWAAPQPPIEGVLALSVDEFRRVTFVGRGPDKRLTSSFSEVSALSLEDVAIDEIRVLPGWLTGIVAPISCGPPDPGTYIADLPGRYCSSPSWLAPDPMTVDPNGYTIPDDWLQLQSNAYLDFAPDPAGANGSAEPREGLYVIAKRLEGSGCPNDEPPCWQWEVLGRVTLNADGSPVEPVSTPSPSVPPTAPPTSPASSGVRFECVGPPLTPGETPGPGPIPIVIDETGLVEGCAQTDYITELAGQISVSNPFEANAIEVVWAEGPCDAAIEFTFRAADDGYELAGKRPISCSESRGSLPLYIRFRQSIPAETVAASISDGALVPSPTPAPTSEISFTAIDCSGRPGDSQWPTEAIIHDRTGLIEACEPVEGSLEIPRDRLANPDGDMSLLRVDWLGSCDGHVNFTFDQVVDRYELVGEGGTCMLGVGVHRAVLIHLMEDVSAATVSMLWRPATAASPPPTTPAPEVPVRELDCPHATLDQMPIVSITDHTGLVTQCAEQVVPGGPDDFVSIWADAGDPLRLNIRWRVGCAGGLATDVELWTIDHDRSGVDRPPTHLIHLQHLDEQDGCTTAMGTQGVTLTLAATAVADDWQAFLTRGVTGTDWDGASDEEFVLNVTASAQEYAPFDAIDLSTSVTYVGPLASSPVAGNGNGTPHLAVYQLDGDIAWSTGPMILPCLSFDPLLRDVPLTGDGRFPESWSAQDPDAPFFEQYTQDGQLTLPEGTYLIRADSRFNTGDRCSGETVSLATSIVIEVR